MRRSTACVSLAAVPLWCACAAAATGQAGTGQEINERAGQAAIFQGDAVGFVETLRASLAVPGPLPPGWIVVTAEVRPMLDRMWRDSPTFRRQCARLVDASVTVVVRLVGPSGLAVAAISRINIQHGLVASAEISRARNRARPGAARRSRSPIGRDAWCARRRDRPPGTVRDCEGDQSIERCRIEALGAPHGSMRPTPKPAKTL